MAHQITELEKLSEEFFPTPEQLEEWLRSKSDNVVVMDNEAPGKHNPVSLLLYEKNDNKTTVVFARNNYIVKGKGFLPTPKWYLKILHEALKINTPIKASTMLSLTYWALAE